MAIGHSSEQVCQSFHMMMVNVTTSVGRVWWMLTLSQTRTMRSVLIAVSFSSLDMSFSPRLTKVSHTFLTSQAQNQCNKHEKPISTKSKKIKIESQNQNINIRKRKPSEITVHLVRCRHMQTSPLARLVPQENELASCMHIRSSQNPRDNPWDKTSQPRMHNIENTETKAEKTKSQGTQILKSEKPKSERK